MNEAATVVVMTRDQLRELVTEVIRDVLEDRPANAPDWLDTATTAELLQVHPRTVAKLAKSGELPGTRIGRMWRFRRSDVEAYLTGERDR